MTTINLPVGTINNIIAIDDPRLEVPIEQIFGTIEGSGGVRTMDTTYKVVEKNINGKDCKLIEFESAPCFINRIKKLAVKNTSVKYFKVVVKFENEVQKQMIVPSYVKFFSKITKQFIPVEFIGKADMMVDYMHHNVMLKSCEEVEFAPTEYYNILLNSQGDIQSTFYFNGILSQVYFVNLQQSK